MNVATGLVISDFSQDELSTSTPLSLSSNQKAVDINKVYDISFLLFRIIIKCVYVCHRTLYQLHNNFFFIK